MINEVAEDEGLLSKLRGNLVIGCTSLDLSANTFGIIEEDKHADPINVKQVNARMEKWRYMLDNHAAFMKKSPYKCTVSY
jgi:hypothetical protein